MTDVIVLDKKTDLVYLPDDDHWYLQLYYDKKGNTKTSPLYSSKEVALKAWRTGVIRYE